uniref:Ovule protein n=1 Tax=Panagrolaimus sp. PS1159 TaxID=55785 RepID=A0AC35EYV0_9BILA
MGKTVIACYDSKNPNLNAKGGCDPGQCEFKAGVLEDLGKKLIWFKSDKNLQSQYENKCETAVMSFPEATPYGFRPFPSCEPLKHDGNIVKLYVHHVPPGCPFYVLNAKIWTPPPPTPSQNSSKTDEQNQTTPKSSNAEMWIGIGVGIFIIFVIIIIGFGYCYYRTQIQKKPLFGNKKEIQPNAAESKKAEDKKEEKQQQKPAKKKLPKEKKA